MKIIKETITGSTQIDFEIQHGTKIYSDISDMYENDVVFGGDKLRIKTLKLRRSCEILNSVIQNIQWSIIGKAYDFEKDDIPKLEKIYNIFLREKKLINIIK